MTTTEQKIDALLQRGMGRVFNFSIVVGTKACDAACPFCVSQMTGFVETPPSPNMRRFHKAARLAQIKGTTNVL